MGSRKKASYKIDNWIKKHSRKHFCHCGCGKKVKILRYSYRKGIPKFLPSHNSKLQISLKIKKKCSWCGKTLKIHRCIKKYYKNHFCNRNHKYKFFKGRDKCLICEKKRIFKSKGITLCHKHYLSLASLRHFLYKRGLSGSNIPLEDIKEKAEIRELLTKLKGVKNETRIKR